jgi:hypothetical protein
MKASKKGRNIKKDARMNVSKIERRQKIKKEA